MYSPRIKFTQLGYVFFWLLLSAFCGPQFLLLPLLSAQPTIHWRLDFFRSCWCAAIAICQQIIWKEYTVRDVFNVFVFCGRCLTVVLKISRFKIEMKNILWLLQGFFQSYFLRRCVLSSLSAFG